MNGDLNSNDLIMAMLRAQLEGNEIKLILAYVSKGGWKHGTEVFLPESVRTEYGLTNSTVKRARKKLIEKGWLIPTGNKSRYGCDKYLLTIPRVVHPDPPRQVNLNPQVVHSDPSGSSNRSPEVTKELTKEVPNQINEEEETPGADAPGSPMTIRPEGYADLSPSSGLTTSDSDSSELPTGRPAVAGPTEDRRTQLREQVRHYRQDLTEKEVDEMVSGMLDREELGRLKDEARTRHQETQKDREKEYASW